jgi:hypothetical protein
MPPPKKMPSEDEHVGYAPGKIPPPNFILKIGTHKFVDAGENPPLNFILNIGTHKFSPILVKILSLFLKFSGPRLQSFPLTRPLGLTTLFQLSWVDAIASSVIMINKPTATLSGKHSIVFDRL